MGCVEIPTCPRPGSRSRIIPAVSGVDRRLVWSSGAGRVCIGCGWPADDCRCSSARDEPVPASAAKVTAKLRIEKKGRGGREVTVIDGLPRNAPFLEALARDLKKACGTGGTVAEGCVELQGDRRERLRTLLAARGFAVKG